MFIGDIADSAFLKSLPKGYDLLVLGDVLEHVMGPDAAIRELVRHGKKGCQVIISVPNIAHLYIRLTLLAGIFDYWDKGILDRTHVRFFTKSSFLRFLKKNALEVLQWSYTPIPLPEVFGLFGKGGILSFLHHLSGISVNLWPRLLAYQFVVLARPSFSHATDKQKQ